ncbi:exodeoxyribonuclease VII large subunit [Rickettsiales bacterium]|nr:exodeoxyribonuclease VII large subunit [Rickettsiales bacterium]
MLKEYTVSEVSKAIKLLIEDQIGYVKIKGEISGFKKASSGHLYFSLKDSNSLISAVLFRGSASIIKFDIEDGLEVFAYGRVTTYAGRSNYQIIVEKLEIAGVGAMMEMIEKRRKKFLELGYFDIKHKKQLPFWPKEIAVITSKTGAVIHDILHRIEDRFPTKISLYPVAVQGQKAHLEVIDAIKYFENCQNKPNLIIIARGGGSFEDLLPFNEEGLIEAVFTAKIPIISAIGHETDTSLIDYVSDLRAPTPTAAAEIATPILSELKYGLENLDLRLNNQIRDFLERKAQDLDRIDNFLTNPTDYLDKLQVKINDFGSFLKLNLQNNIQKQEQKMNFIDNSFKDFDYKIIEIEQNIKDIFDKITQKMQENIKNYENRLEISDKLLINCNYKNVLKRGYALLSDDNGNFIKNVADLNKKAIIEMQDGKKEIMPIYN